MSKHHAQKPRGNGKTALLIIALAGLGIGYCFGNAFPLTDLFRSASRQTSSSSFDFQREAKFRFINPLLDCGESFTELTPFKADVEELIAAETAARNITTASVYFREMNNGYTLQVNPEEKFFPASLLKVPVLIAAFKYAESRPGLLASPVPYTLLPGLPYKPTFNYPTPLQADEEYPLLELLESMVVYSDNNAALLVEKYIDQGVFNQMHLAFGLDIPTKGYEITAQDYSRFFRVLYNASYLSREMSELALSLLAKSAFNQGLVAGVNRPDITISHKFGERSSGTFKQLHDCGIVYYPSNPYLICVLTKGDDYHAMARSLAGISRLIFEEVQSQSR